MVQFTLDKQGRKHWEFTFGGVRYLCVNQDVANEMFKLFTQRAVKVAHNQEGV